MDMGMIGKDKADSNRDTILFFLLGVVTELHLDKIYFAYQKYENASADESIDLIRKALEFESGNKMTDSFNKSFYKLQLKCLNRTLEFPTVFGHTEDVYLTFSKAEVDIAVNKINNSLYNDRELSSLLTGAMYCDSIKNPNTLPSNRGIPGLFTHIDMVKEIKNIYTKDAEAKWKRRLQVGKHEIVKSGWFNF
jgi:hypothetical protein